MKRSTLSIAVFLAAAVIFTSLLTLFGSGSMTTVSSQGGRADLSALDLDDQIAVVRPDGMEFYPDLHLEPGAFDGAPTPRSFTNEDKSATQYGTYRLRLHLPAGETYALRAMAVNFAQRIWINGKEQESVGWPGQTAQDTKPAARTVLCMFVPETEETEVVIQYANFVYRGGGEAYPLYVSRYANILRMERNMLFRDAITAGCMLTIFLFYLGMYLFFQRQPYFLAFALSTLAIAMRGLLVGEKFLASLLHSLDWYTAMKLEYLALIVMIAAFMLYVAGMFRNLLHRKGLTAYMAVCAIFALIVLTTSPDVFSRGLLAFHAVSVPYGVYVIVRLLMRMRRNRELESLLILSGGCLYMAGLISEAYFHSRSVHTGISGMDQPAMLVFIFANMVALAIRFARTEQQLSEATELNRMKTEFFNHASHDLKTPVAAMGLALQRLEEVSDEGLRTQFLSAARRGHADMARLLGNLLSAARLDENIQRYRLTSISIEDLCAAIQEKYEDTLSLDGVELEVSAYTRRALTADAGMLWSVLDNLIYNALRYTPTGGRIRVTAREAEGGVTLTVSDTGPGIPPQHLPYIFNRGYTVGAQSNTGMGLYIVKTAVEAMGGSVRADNAPEGGAVFTLLFPVG